jgi:hypothetical protein
MDAQKDFFDIIRKKIPAHLRLSDTVGDLLKIGSDSVYRRIRGEKELTMSELIKLCNHFDISIDSILDNAKNRITFDYQPLSLTDLNSYRIYIKQLAESVQALSNAAEKEIYYTADDISVFHFMPFYELTLFKVYVWYHAVSEYNIPYEKFIRQINNKEELFECYDKLYEGYLKIPATEVWTTGTITTILRLLDYSYDMGVFENKDTPMLLANQLLQMIDRVMKWAETGRKENRESFNLYLSATNPENSYLIFKNEGFTSIMIKLYTINGITTSHPAFCEETEKWVKNTISKSTLLSGSSARERVKFFQTMKNQIADLMERFLSQQE